LPGDIPAITLPAWKIVFLCASVWHWWRQAGGGVAERFE